MAGTSEIQDTAAPKMDARFVPPSSEIQAVLDRFTRQKFDPASAAWRQARQSQISNRTLGWRKWLKRHLASGRNARQQSEVKGEYEGHWTQKDALVTYVTGLDSRDVLVEWRDYKALVSVQVLRHVHLLYLARAIEQLQPSSVLEVGFGNGNLLLTLAGCFPDIAMQGVELTASGLAIAQDLQSADLLPEAFTLRSPLPVRDAAAHRRVALRQGNAGALPFADRSVDLVYTRLALEQMEAIRKKALHEITRVAARAVVLIEPWRDFNQTGPARDYIIRQGYFAAWARDLAGYGFDVVLASDDLPQKVQFRAGPVVALRRSA